MTIGTVKTQGTELYFADTTGASDINLIKLTCPTGISGIGGGAKDTIDTTCLDTTGDRENVTGLGTPSPITAPFNFIPSSGAHQALMRLKASGEKINWLALFSDGTMAPTLGMDDAITPPASPNRTSVGFLGSVSEVNIDVATNEIVRGTLTILRSGSETWYWNGPVPA